MFKTKNIKKAYVIPCSSNFRNRVEVLCRQKKVNAGDVARSVILMVPDYIIKATDDPGEPDTNDREPVSSTSKNKRKPRLQVRIPEGYNAEFIRKSLNLALLLAEGKVELFTKKEKFNDEELAKIKEDNEKLRTIISSLMSEPIYQEITTMEEAFYILGIRPFSHPSLAQIKQKFRMLATIHHPDGELGSHERMSKLNEAMDFLAKKLS